jgi:hypothetical protein
VSAVLLGAWSAETRGCDGALGAVISDAQAAAVDTASAAKTRRTIFMGPPEVDRYVDEGCFGSVDLNVARIRPDVERTEHAQSHISG